MGKSDDPQIQCVHRENAERMLLSSFISGLHGVPGRQIQFSNPQDIDQALKIFITLQKAERQEQFNESFIPDFISRYSCVHGPLADRAQKNISSSHLTHEREVSRTPSGIANGAALAGQRPSVRETRRHKKRCVVINATVLGILEGNSPQGSKREPEHLFRQV